MLRGLIVQSGSWIHVERDGYGHRQHDENTSTTVPATLTQVSAAMQRVLPVLMPLILKNRHVLLKLANHLP